MENNNVAKDINGKKLKVSITSIITTAVAIIMLCITVASLTYSTTMSSVQETFGKILELNATSIRENSAKNASQDNLLTEIRTQLTVIMATLVEVKADIKDIQK